MRIIGTLFHENEARRFSSYLNSEGIPNNCEMSFDPASGEMSYQIWIHNEEQIEGAALLFQEFEKTPSDRKFDLPFEETDPAAAPETKEPPRAARRYPNRLAPFLIALCSFVFFLNTLQQISLREEGLSERNFLLTPIQAFLMYDLPAPFEELEKIEQKDEGPNRGGGDVPLEVEKEIQKVSAAPYWEGIYGWALGKLKGEPVSLRGVPLFVKLRQGEIWRLVSPCVLHTDLLHILFNMIWVWFLARPIEQRIGPFPLLIFTLAAAMISNTVQYLISGPFFIGYSGVVMAMAGFIWMRQKEAPWEGYPVSRTTLLFLLFFVGAIFVLQGAAFFIQIVSSKNFAPNIANSAHLGGAIWGILLGKLRFFAQRIRQ